MELYESDLRNEKACICGKNSRHTMRKIDGTYHVSFYIPGYGVDKERSYKSLPIAKAAITRYDKRF